MPIIDFPNSGWLTANYPETQKASQILMKLEKVSKKKCTCVPMSYTSCNSCLAKKMLAQILGEIDCGYVRMILLQDKNSKK